MILVVDDEPFYVESYVEELQDLGYEVSVQKDVDAAIKFYEQHRKDIDLVILDIMMRAGATFKSIESSAGLKTGMLLYDLLRQRAPTLPIIVLTNVTSSEVKRRFAGESNCRFVRKDQCLPFELSAVLEELLSSRDKRV